MAEYIERDAAKKEFCLYFGGVSHAAIAVRLLDEIPAADVVEVVRCKDCKHRDAIFVCAQFDADVGAMHFCSLGERRSDG